VIEVIIRNNTIFLKSYTEFYQKEESDIKNNTVRFFHDQKEEQEMITFAKESETEQKSIEITNADNPLISFKRTIRDISQFGSCGMWCWIITWNPEAKK